MVNKVLTDILYHGGNEKHQIAINLIIFLIDRCIFQRINGVKDFRVISIYGEELADELKAFYEEIPLILEILEKLDELKFKYNHMSSVSIISISKYLNRKLNKYKYEITVLPMLVTDCYFEDYDKDNYTKSDLFISGHHMAYHIVYALSDLVCQIEEKIDVHCNLDVG